MPTNCQSYLPGHHVHWIPGLNKWADLPRHEITEITTNPNDTFTVVSNGVSQLMHFHDPDYFRTLLRSIPTNQWFAVGNTGAIQTKGTTNQWIYLSPTPVPNCADEYIKHIKENYDRAVTRTKHLIEKKELPEQAAKAKEFLTHLEYIKTLKYWDDHIIEFDLFGAPKCSCALQEAKG